MSEVENPFMAAPVVSLDEYKQWCEKYAKYCTHISELEAKIEEWKELRAPLQKKIEDVLETMGKTEEAFDFGKFQYQDKIYFPNPQGANETKFYDYLKKLKVYDDLLSINNKTLGAWVKRQRDALGENDDWTPPGIDKKTMKEFKFKPTKVKGK